DGGTCKRQNCNGRGSCLRNDGYDCGTCAECQDGECVYDSSQHEDCGLCQRCTARFTCGNQTTSQDLKDECDAGDCTTGNCSGTGAACGRRANGTVCGELYCERTELRQPVCQAGACTGSSLVEDCGYSSGCERGRCIGGACEVLCVDTAGACGSGERCGYNEWGECTCIPMLK
ncbi:MAG: hypothetical protein JXR96_10900, partial [Deltaproteobacteria bacterium]|nr:hypothetical protein [Deltaproteobacteria bacterium]